jgi:Outer membrane lipoprotein
MTDPTRLVDDGTRLGRAVLASVEDDAAPADLRRKIHAAVIVGTVGAGVGAASTATAATKTTSWVASLTVTKCVGIVAVGAVVSVGAHAVTRPSLAKTDRTSKTSIVSTQPSQAHGTAYVQPALSAQEISPVLGMPIASSAPVVGTESSPPAQPSFPVLATAPAATATPYATSSQPAPSTEDFTQEVIALDSARTALESSDFDAAIEKLNRHDLDYPHGHLRPEALAIRVQAYAAKHDAVRARELAAQFLSEYPNHPFAAHARTMIESANP